MKTFPPGQPGPIVGKRAGDEEEVRGRKMHLKLSITFTCPSKETIKNKQCIRSARTFISFPGLLQQDGVWKVVMSCSIKRAFTRCSGTDNCMKKKVMLPRGQAPCKLWLPKSESNLLFLLRITIWCNFFSPLLLWFRLK